MRIARLDLLRYGRFTGTSLDFPDNEADVHIVFGPNEAGKSTALAAIEDLLFGIPTNSTYNFVHEYGSMRVGGRLNHRSESLDARRRKGRKDTLLDPDDLPFPSGEAALAPFLGGADRSFFARMFSLNHERLAKGGRDILEAGDEAGQTLFSASSGIADLHNLIAALDHEADQLWAPRRAAHRKYYHAHDNMKEADKALREHTITATKWHETKKTFDDAQEECAELEREIESRDAEQRKLGRIRRLYRPIRRLSELEVEHNGLGDVKSLPDDAGERLETATQNVAKAQSKIQELENQLAQAKSERAELVYDDAILSRKEEIRQLHERRFEIQKEKIDLPNRKTELKAAETRMRGLADELERDSADIDVILAWLPKRTKVISARTILTERGERSQAFEFAQKALDESKVECAEQKRVLEESAAAIDVSHLAAAIQAARELGDFGSRIGGAEKEFRDLQQSIEMTLDPLRPQVDDEQTLLKMPAPPRSIVQKQRDSNHSLEEERRACRERISAIEKEIAMDRKAYDEMAGKDNTISPEELAEVREHRDLGWALVRRRYVEGNAVTKEELTAFGSNESKLTKAYEDSIAKADHLADRRFDHAQAAGQLASIKRRIEDQQELLATLRKENAGLDEQKKKQDTYWIDLWSEAEFEPLSPEHMLDWLDARDKVRDLSERRDRTRTEVESLKNQEANARKPIIAELIALGENAESLKDKPLRVLLELATDIQHRHRKEAERKAGLATEFAKRESDRAQNAAEFEKHEAAWRKWESEWRDALKTLDLDETVSFEAVAVQLDVIEEMRGVEKEIKHLRHERIEKIEKDIAGFTDLVGRLAGSVATDLDSSNPEETVIALERRLEGAQQTLNRQKEKDKVIESIEKRIEGHESDAREARETLRELHDASGAEDIEQLKDAIAKSERKRMLETELAELEKNITVEGDGHPLQDLRAECDGAVLDDIAAREATIQLELGDLRDRLTAATENRVSARQAFDAIGGDQRSAQAAAMRQEALADMRDCAEQYVRVRTASTLLRWTIERYRRDKQAPLLNRAEKVFSSVTSGSFSGLRVEYDEQDNAHIVGIRPDNSIVRLGGMSDGTADQLYLALRLASIDEYLGRAHPLPFVADDLFINFDDKRAAAGFLALAELGRITQVLFFTHHWHQVEIARKVLGDSINIVTLDEEKIPVTSQSS